MTAFRALGWASKGLRALRSAGPVVAPVLRNTAAQGLATARTGAAGLSRAVTGTPVSHVRELPGRLATYAAGVGPQSSFFGPSGAGLRARAGATAANTAKLLVDPDMPFAAHVPKRLRREAGFWYRNAVAANALAAVGGGALGATQLPGVMRAQMANAMTPPRPVLRELGVRSPSGVASDTRNWMYWNAVPTLMRTFEAKLPAVLQPLGRAVNSMADVDAVGRQLPAAVSDSPALFAALRAAAGSVARDGATAVGREALDHHYRKAPGLAVLTDALRSGSPVGAAATGVMRALAKPLSWEDKMRLDASARAAATRAVLSHGANYLTTNTPLRRLPWVPGQPRQ